MFKRTALKTWVRVSWRHSQMLHVWGGWTAVSTSAGCWLQSNIVTECQHYCLSPWWSFMWEHLAHTPLSIPSSFSMHQKPSLSSDIQNTFPLFLLYMSPSATWWLWLIHCEGNWKGPSPLNSNAPTKNWNQTSKISQPRFNIRTNKQHRGTCTISHSPASCTTENSETWPQKFMSFKDGVGWVCDISSVLAFGLQEWDWETGRVNSATWGFPLHNNRRNYNMRAQLLILTHSRSSYACTRSQQCSCSGTTCKRAAVLGKPPEGTGNPCGGLDSYCCSADSSVRVK